MCDIRLDLPAIADHNHAIGGCHARVPPAEDGRTLTHRQQQSRYLPDQRCLAAAPDGEIAHTDNRRGQTAPQIRATLKISPARSDELTVEKLKQSSVDEC